MRAIAADPYVIGCMRMCVDVCGWRHKFRLCATSVWFRLALVGDWRTVSSMSSCVRSWTSGPILRWTMMTFVRCVPLVARLGGERRAVREHRVKGCPLSWRRRKLYPGRVSLQAATRTTHSASFTIAIPSSRGIFSTRPPGGPTRQLSTPARDPTSRQIVIRPVRDAGRAAPPRCGCARRACDRPR